MGEPALYLAFATGTSASQDLHVELSVHTPHCLLRRTPYYTTCAIVGADRQLKSVCMYLTDMAGPSQQPGQYSFFPLSWCTAVLAADLLPPHPRGPAGLGSSAIAVGAVLEVMVVAVFRLWLANCLSGL